MFRFASERKALARPGELTALDPDAFRRYLAFQYVPAPATMTPPVRVLPPGHAMIVRPERPSGVPLLAGRAAPGERPVGRDADP